MRISPINDGNWCVRNAWHLGIMIILTENPSMGCPRMSFCSTKAGRILSKYRWNHGFWVQESLLIACPPKKVQAAVQIQFLLNHQWIENWRLLKKAAGAYRNPNYDGNLANVCGNYEGQDRWQFLFSHPHQPLSRLNMIPVVPHKAVAEVSK